MSTRSPRRPTRYYESARAKVGRFIGAPNPETEVLFAKNATEGLNLVATSWAATNLKPGDVVLLTEMEHHANLVPWLMLAEQKGIELRWIEIDDAYRLDLSDLDRLLGRGEARRVHGHVERARHDPAVRDRSPQRPTAVGAVVVADGAQAVPHLPVDVNALGCDFLAFSAHKMLGPTGIGVLWGRQELLEAMPPFLGGGGMIRDVRKDGFTPERAAVEVRGRHAADRRGRRPRRCGRLPVGDRHAACHRPRQAA